MSEKEFIERAKKVHGDRYDYGNVDYVNTSTKILIKCNQCGNAFWQRPDNHLQGKGCSNSACVDKRKKEVFLNKYGVNNPMKLDYFKEKSKRTSLRRYGVEHPMKSELIKDRLKKANVKKYGVDNPARLDFFKNKVRSTCMKKYNSPYFMGTDEFFEKSRKTLLDKYGTSHQMKSEIGRQKFRVGCLKKYGVDHPMKCKQISDKVKSTFNSGVPVFKMIQTKRKNGTFNTSKIQNELYLKLKEKFGEEDVEEEYRDERYPFNCDFYVKSLDLFIELNAFWTHGGHFFNKIDKNDLGRLSELEEKSQKSKYYKNAIDVWINRDVLKRKTARKNNLNYVVLWNQKDIDEWFNNGCPLRQDWK